MSEGICAKCATPLEGTNWRWINGRGYHAGCEPQPGAFTTAKANAGSLGAFAERKARNVLQGRGQRMLEEESADG